MLGVPDGSPPHRVWFAKSEGDRAVELVKSGVGWQAIRGPTEGDREHLLIAFFVVTYAYAWWEYEQVEAVSILPENDSATLPLERGYAKRVEQLSCTKHRFQKAEE